MAILGILVYIIDPTLDLSRQKAWEAKDSNKASVDEKIMGPM